MINILKKIIYTGIVTEQYDGGPVSARFRGQVVMKEKFALNAKSVKSALPFVRRKPSLLQGKRYVLIIKPVFFVDGVWSIVSGKEIEHTADYKLATMSDCEVGHMGTLLKERIKSLFNRSLQIRHVDVGSCNACDFEMNALSNPIYDLQRYGIDFVASPRHADLLMVTGVVTRNLTQALLMTYEAVPTPKMVMAVGACAASGQILGSPYAVRGAVDELVPVDIYVPGCPPRPQALLYGLLLVMNKL